MFELPEFVILAEQMNNSLRGKAVHGGHLGNTPHKFVWYNRTHDEFERLTRGKIVGEAWAKGKWLFIPLEPGYVLLLGEFGGRVLHHLPGSKVPKKYHLHITFEDDSYLTATTQMWGAIELYEQGDEGERQYIKGMRTTPIEPQFTFEYFSALIDDLMAEKKRSAKGLLTQDQLIPGLGNAIAQDILFRARIHPRHAIDDLSTAQRQALYRAILDTVHDVIEEGGRYDEYDLHGRRGGYIRLMDAKAVDRPCPECGGTIEKMQYLGGACYYCSNCQE
ncbi:MAG: endonuclease VIII [Gemmatimonadota bacterium]|nr:MAG: endonuclease VIII [Gemmatimonadota bacterium]